MNYRISHPTKMIECEINLPSSKSISNRLLIIQSLCREKFEIKNLSDSDDTISLQSALSNTTNTIDVGAAGTSFRFLASYLSTLEGKEFILTGTRRIQERPIKELVDALKNLGANISKCINSNSHRYEYTTSSTENDFHGSGRNPLILDDLLNI